MCGRRAALWRSVQMFVRERTRLLIRPVNTLLVFRAAAQARYTPGLGSRGLSPRRGIPAPD